MLQRAIISRRARHVITWLSLCFTVWGCDGDRPDSADSAAISGDAGLSDSRDAMATPMSRGLADGVVGSACSSAMDCGSGSCMQNIPIVNVAYPGGYCSGVCSRDDQCGDQGVCVAGPLPGSPGSCYLRCDEQHACTRVGYRCRVVSGVGRCIAGPPPLSDHVSGNACEGDADCGGGPMSCASTLGGKPAKGGYCSQACAINDDCGAGGVCINGISIATISSGRCLKACKLSSECRDGYVCSLFGGPNIQGGDGACTAIADDDAGSP